MSIIDLIKSCELQLDPIPTLVTDFDSATDSFFEALEAQAAASDIRVEAAASLRTSIDTYRTSCTTILASYTTEMALRRENEGKVTESLQVSS